MAIADEDTLRRTALLLGVIQTVSMSVLPAIEYYYVFRLDNYEIGPQAWTIWAAAIVMGLLGVLAHGSANVILTIYHLIITGLLSAALAAYSTAWSFVMQLQCGMTQTAFRGCSAIACPCAASGSCSVADFAYGGCTECLAPAAPMCSEALKESNAYVLAFTGLVVLLVAIPVLCLDVQILISISDQRTTTISRLQATSVAVEQQTRLIAAGDKPTVTPGTLSDWVSLLLNCPDDHDDEACLAMATRCLNALRGRGYELPVKGTGRGGKGGGRARPTGSRDSQPDTALAGRASYGGTAGGSCNPAPSSIGGIQTRGGGDDAMDAAERGGRQRPKKLQQITPENSEAIPMWIPAPSPPQNT